MEIKKVILVVLASIILLQSAAAQDLGGSNQDIWNQITDAGVQATELAVEITGVNQSIAEQNPLQFWATLGLIFLVMYFVIEKGAEVADVKDILVIDSGGVRDSGEDKKRLYALTLLTFLVFAGSNIFAPLIALLSTSIVIAAGGGFLLLVYYSLFYARGGLNTLAAGGKDFLASSTEAEAQAHKDLKKAERESENIKDMEKEIKEIEGDMTKLFNEGDLKGEEQDMEALLSKFKNLEKYMMDTERTVQTVLRDVHEEDSKLVEEEKEVRDRLEDAEEKIEEYYVAMEAVISDYSGGGYSKSALNNAISGLSISIEDHDQLDVAIQEVMGAMEEEVEVFEILHDQEEILGKLEALEESISGELKFFEGEMNDADDIMRKAEELARKMGDKDDSEFIKREEQKNGSLENRFKKILQAHKDSEEGIKDAKQQISELESNAAEHLKLVKSVASHLDDIRRELDPSASGSAYNAFNAAGMKTFADRQLTLIRDTNNKIASAQNKIQRFVA